MKTLNTQLVRILSTSIILGLTGLATSFAATTPSPGMTTTYSILSNTYTNTTPGTTINGDIGFTTGPAIVPLGIHTNYGPAAPYAQAGIDQSTILNALSLEPCTYTFAAGAVDLSTDT